MASFGDILDRCRRMAVLPTLKKPQDVLDAINRWHIEKKPNIQFRKIEVLKRLGKRPRNRDKREYWAKRIAWALTGGVPNVVFPTWGSMMETLRENFLSVTGTWDAAAGWRPRPYDKEKLDILLSVVKGVSVVPPTSLELFGGKIRPEDVFLTTHRFPDLSSFQGMEHHRGVNYREHWAGLGAKAARFLIRYAEHRYRGHYTKPVLECHACGKLFVANRVTVKRDVDWDPRTGRKLTKVIVYPRACSRRCQDKLKNQAAKQKKLRLHDGPRS